MATYKVDTLELLFWALEMASYWLDHWSQQNVQITM